MCNDAKGAGRCGELQATSNGDKGLIDADIFPMVTRGNLQTSVYAFAEKATDLIKEDLRAA